MQMQIIVFFISIQRQGGREGSERRSGNSSGSQGSIKDMVTDEIE